MIDLMIGAAAALANPAFTAPSYVLVQGAPSARVATAGVDLRTGAGRLLVAGRIRSAAQGLCSEANIDPLEIRLARIECYRVAVAGGLAQLDTIAGR